jgi:hypothetical protein
MLAENSVEVSVKRDSFLSIPSSHYSSGQTSVSLSFYITSYQLQEPPVVKLHVMSHQNYGVDLHYLEVLNHGSLNCCKGWVIHPQERGFVLVPFFILYFKLLQKLMLTQEKNEHIPCYICLPTTCLHSYHFTCILDIVPMCLHSWFAADVYRRRYAV